MVRIIISVFVILNMDFFVVVEMIFLDTSVLSMVIVLFRVDMGNSIVEFREISGPLVIIKLWVVEIVIAEKNRLLTFNEISKCLPTFILNHAKDAGLAIEKIVKENVPRKGHQECPDNFRIRPKIFEDGLEDKALRVGNLSSFLSMQMFYKCL